MAGSSGLLRRRGYGYTSLRQDLALTGKTFESVMGRKVVGFAIGFLLALIAVVAVTVFGGVSLPAGSPVIIGFAGRGRVFRAAGSGRPGGGREAAP